MKKIHHVKQEDENGCGIACAAMVAGVSYSDARKIADAHPFLNTCSKLGCQHIQMSKLLRLLGVTFKRHMLPGFPTDGPYIMSVPSLNVQASGHYIVLDFFPGYWNIHDPQRGIVGKLHYKSHVDKDDTDGIAVNCYYQVIRITGEAKWKAKRSSHANYKDTQRMETLVGTASSSESC